MNEEARQFYEYLKSQNITVPDTYEEFENTMQDEKSASQMHSFVKANGITVPEDTEEFIKFLKKKEFSELPLEETDSTELPIDQNAESPQLSDGSEEGVDKPASDDPFEEAVQFAITPDLIDKEEEFVVPEMKYRFSDYGFSFEESGPFGDQMKVTADNNKTLTVNLDRMWSQEGTAKELEIFLRKNKMDPSSVVSSSNDVIDNRRKFKDKEEIKNVVSNLNKQEEALQSEIVGYSKAKENLDAVYEADFKGVSKQEIRSNEELLGRYNTWVGKMQELDKVRGDIDGRVDSLGKNKENLNTAAGRYAEMKGSQGEWSSGLVNSLLDGIGRMTSGSLSAFADITFSATDPTKKELLNAAKELGSEIEFPKEATIEDIEVALNEAWGESEVLSSTPSFDDVVSKANDIAKKGFKYGDEQGGGVLDPARKGTRDVLGSSSTTTEWSDLTKEGFWGGAMLGVTESIPAMMGGSGPVGFIQRTAQMYAQVSDHLEEEMSNNPEFDNISENEKLLVKAPVGVAVGVLESIGFRNIMNQRGLLNSVVAKALGKSSKGTTAKTFSEFVRQDVENAITRGALTITAAGLAEFETGAAQEIVDISAKQIYNTVKEKEMFSTPESTSEYVGQVLKAGAQEAVGALVLGAPSAVANAAAGLDMQSLDEGVFEIFEEMSKDPEMKAMYVTSLKQKISDSSDPTTVKEAKEELDMVNTLEGLLPKIPSEFTTKQKKEALQLLMQKKALEAEIDKEDGILSKKKKDLLDKVDERLAKMVGEEIEESVDKKGEPKEGRGDKGPSTIPDKVQSEEKATDNTQAGIVEDSPSEEKITVHRGKGNNYAETDNEGFHWVSTDEKVAAEYGETESEEISKPTKTFVFPQKDPNTHVRSEQVGQALRQTMIQMIKNKELTQEEWRHIQGKIAQFEEAAGDNLERLHNKINKPESAKLLSEILAAMGYDAVEMVENGAATYGIIKESVVEDTIEDVLEVDTKDPTNLEKVKSYLDGIDAGLTKFGKESAGMNLALPVMQAVVKTLRVLVEGGISLQEAIKQAAAKHKVSEKDIKESLGAIEKAAVAKKLKKKPKKKKVRLKPKDKKVTVNERTALKDQIRLEARAARESKQDQDSKRKGISKLVSDLVDKMRDDATVKKKKLNSIQKRISKVNLNNPVMVERLIGYIDNVLQDANYDAKLKEATQRKARVRRMSNNKKKSAGLRAVGKAFNNIDPRLVDDIDAYIEMAKVVMDGLKPTQSKSSGVDAAIPFDTKSVSEYIAESLKNQQAVVEKALAAEFESITGIPASDLSFEEMNEFLADLETSPEKKKENAQFNKGQKKEKLKAAFNAYAAVVSDLVNEKRDPFTGEPVDITDKEKKMMLELVGMDTDLMSSNRAIEAIDAMSNFIVNGSIDGVEMQLAQARGRESSNSLVNEGVKAKNLKLVSGWVSRIFAEHFTSLPIVLERMFGKTKSRAVAVASGLQGIMMGKAKAIKQARNVIDSYFQEFSKKKPNGEAFNTRENSYERGVLGAILRTISGGEKAEFTRKKGLIKQTIEALETGSDVQKEMAEGYQAVYDRILKGATSIEEAVSRADDVNLKAVQWWIDEWNTRYDDLSNVSAEVYNEQLDKDINYTPDVFKGIDGSNTYDITQSSFFNAASSVDKNKTGTLMETTRPSKLPVNEAGQPTRYLNLDFDQNNSDTFQAALTDINTASSVMQMDGFIKSNGLLRMIENKKDREVLVNRLKGYVDLTKGKTSMNTDSEREMSKKLDFIATLGVSKALGGVFQSVKQTVSVGVNTIVNSGRFPAIGMIMSDSNLNSWLEATDMPIINRGMSSRASLDFESDLVEKAARSKGEAAIKYIKKLNEFYLKKFLQNPDVFIAKASFVAYYKQHLQKNGIEFSLDEYNQGALDYAQQQVDRQQNTSDADLQGDFFTSTNTWTKGIRKIAVPFTNFVMNQKARMMSDVRAITSNSVTMEDKKIAIRSLGGLSAEMVTFYAISAGVRELMFQLTDTLFGYDDDEERKKKRLEQNKKIARTGLIKDFLSPTPFLDDAVMEGLKSLISKMPKDSQVDIYGKYDNGSVFQDFGSLGIAADKGMKVVEIEEMIRTKEWTDNWGNTKEIPSKYIGDLEVALAMEAAYVVGFLPVEIDMMVRNIVKEVKRNSKSKSSSSKKTERSER